MNGEQHIFHYIKYGLLAQSYIVNKIDVDINKMVFAYVYNLPSAKTYVSIDNEDLVPYKCDFSRFNKITIRRSELYTSFIYSIIYSDRVHTYKIPERLSLDKIFEVVQTLE